MSNRYNPFLLFFLLVLTLLYIAMKYVIFDLIEQWCVNK
jgi:hypothetical protein